MSRTKLYITTKRIKITFLIIVGLFGLVLSITNDIIASYIQQYILGNNFWLLATILVIFLVLGVVITGVEVREKLKARRPPAPRRTTMADAAFDTLMQRLDCKIQQSGSLKNISEQK